MSGALDGIRVLEWAAWHQSPGAASMLGDLGADVIKLEDRVMGDPFRGVESLHGSSVSVGETNSAFEVINRNKRSITLDFKKDKGKQILHKLAEKSDVFLTNYTLPIAEKLGADYGTLRRYNPRLIYAQASGLGLKGRESLKRSFDTIAQARSGIMYMISDRDHTEPYQIIGGVIDQSGAIMMAYSIVAALLARERTGKGQMVETSLLSSSMNLQLSSIGGYLLNGKERARHSRTRAKNPMTNQYKCQDGNWIMLAGFQSDRFWPKFCEALGKPEMASDPKFKDSKSRSTNCRELITVLDGLFGSKPRAEWLEQLDKGCPEMPAGPVQHISDLPKDPQVLANEYIVDYEHPTLGKIKLVNCPVRFGETPSSIRLPAPAFGQHTEEVLMELCGYSWQDIGQLKEEAVI